MHSNLGLKAQIIMLEALLSSGAKLLIESLVLCKTKNHLLFWLFWEALFLISMQFIVQI